MEKNTESIQSQKNILSLESASNSLNKRLIAICWLIAVVLGALHAWDSRHAMNADGISYLDIGDAYMRGDWKMAINAYWSPLYSWILGLTLHVLKPSPYYEFTVVHFVNFVIYLFTLGCFHFLLLQLIHYHKSRLGEASEKCCATLAEWAWIALGYSLFLYSSLHMITISSVTPDMFVAAFVFLSSGILIRILRGATNYSTFTLLGFVLGFGYLAKSVMFPLAFIFLSISMFSVGNFRKALPRAMVALIFFLFIAVPFIITISNAKGRFTFGDSGKYNYWLEVSSNNIGRHWTGTPPGDGIPSHPIRKIFDKPAIYEFGSPIGGTYPVWYDPSYWYDGIENHIVMNKQLRAILIGLESYFDTLYPSHSVLILGCLILYLMGNRRWLALKDIAEQWNILIPAITALGLYSLVSTAPRYTGPFFTLLWIGVLSGIRLPESEESRKLLRHTSVVMVVVMMMIILQHSPIFSTVRNMINSGNSPPHEQWQIADALNQMGVLPGEKVASIGTSHAHFWARLAKVHIVAEIPDLDADNFWKADSSVKTKVIKTLCRTGAKAIITNLIPNNFSFEGWKRISNSDYYVYMF